MSSTTSSSQNPELTASLLDNNSKYTFTLKNIHTSTANALRRTVLSDIPVYAFRTETEQVNLCKIEENTSRFHNEIVKQRLSCIPIHYPVDREVFVQNLKSPSSIDPKSLQTTSQGGLARYELDLDVQNTTEHQLRWVTTEEFRLKDKETGNYLASEEQKKIFPPNPITSRYIDFLRLRPSIGPTIPGEKIKLHAGIGIGYAREDGMFNVVSICGYQNKIDVKKRDEAWQAYQRQQSGNEPDADKTEQEKLFEKENFYQLQGQRYFVSNKQGEPIEFDFTVQSIGIYEPSTIVHMACDILMYKFRKIMEQIEDDTLIIIPSDRIRESGQYLSVTESTIPNAYDIVLENEDYTVGCVMERMLYDMYYEGEKTLSYVGFKKYHPHDSYSIIRIAHKEDAPALTRQGQIKSAAFGAYDVFKKIRAKIV
jgi:DNA-directed RNA polymerase alpha subunit/DNA-directed RNA polymerase subunit L